MAQVRTLLGAYYWPIKGTSIRGCAYRVKFLGRLRLRSDSLLSAGERRRGGGGGRHLGITELKIGRRSQWWWVVVVVVVEGKNKDQQM